MYIGRYDTKDIPKLAKSYSLFWNIFDGYFFSEIATWL